jgi:preprotein translocase subunit SecD
VQQADATAPTVHYLFKYDPPAVPEATGEDLKLSDIAADISTQGQGNVVRLGFTSKGADKFHEITRAEAQRGAADAAAAGQTGSDPATIQQFAQHFRDRARRPAPLDAVHRLQAEPGRDRPDGHRREISNIQSLGEAKDLALVCRRARCRSSSSRSSARTSRPRSARTRSRRRSSPR